MDNLTKAAKDKQVLDVISHLTPDELEYLHEIARKYKRTKEQVVDDIKTFKPRF